MATATEISTRALRRVGAFDALETPSAVDVANATEALQAMIASWEADGYSGDILPLAPRFEAGIVALLAVRLAEEYGKVPGPVLLNDASKGKAQLDAAFITTPTASFDGALLNGTFRYQNSGADLNESTWQANKEYALRAFVTNAANRYELVTAGTSAASGGPTGTGSDITDGTCVWVWRGVTAE